jgi:hypothetical protein
MTSARYRATSVPSFVTHPTNTEPSELVANGPIGTSPNPPLGLSTMLPSAAPSYLILSPGSAKGSLG